MKLLPPALGAALLLGALPAPSAEAGAAMRCGERRAVIEHLASRFGETRRSLGFQQGRGLIEIFANPVSGSWTILLTTPGGTSCLVAAGEAWRALDGAGPDSPA